MTFPTANTTAIELRSKLEFEELPPQSVVFPDNERNRCWVVTGADGVMAPTPYDSGLEVRNVSQSRGFANGTKALVFVGYWEFVKVPEGWKRLRTAADLKSGGVNVVTGGPVVGMPGLGGFGNFLEMQHPEHYAGVSAMMNPPEIGLQIPLSLAAKGTFQGSDAPVLESNEQGNPPDKLSIIIQVNVSTGETKTYKGAQFNTRTRDRPITLGQLAVHAANVVTALMNQERGERSILCINNLEIDTDDLFLVKLVQLSKGSFRLKIGVRDFQLPV